MRFDILTLFPELVDRVLGESIIGRARSCGAIAVNLFNIRDYSEDKHRKVDDTPYGGGRGMLMAAPPIYNCWKAASLDVTPDMKSRFIYMSPQGRLLTESVARELSGYDRLVVLCGHYEGVDRRVLDELDADEISIGDYVLTGGEIPACILVDCVARLCHGVLPASECFEKESFSEDGTLEYPQYTRPYDFMGRLVPEVLLSGHHENIEKWRSVKSEEVTREKRPELLPKKAASPDGEHKKNRKKKTDDKTGIAG